jgi:1-acyl-sn-glycerol-3-phosphate acyltransferase
MKAFYWLSKNSAGLFMRLTYGIKIYGRENLDFEGPAILASNHISLLDPPIVGSFTPFEIHFMAKAELFRNPLFGNMIKALNSFPVKRGMIDRNALEIAEGLLKSGERVLLFPEGTRQKSGVLAKGRPGAAKIAVDCQVPILPLCIANSNHLRKLVFSRKHLKLCYGKLIDTKNFQPQLPEKDRIRSLSEKVMLEIRKLQEFLETV